MIFALEGDQEKWHIKLVLKAGAKGPTPQPTAHPMVSRTGTVRVGGKKTIFLYYQTNNKAKKQKEKRKGKIKRKEKIERKEKQKEQQKRKSIKRQAREEKNKRK